MHVTGSEMTGEIKWVLPPCSIKKQFIGCLCENRDAHSAGGIMM